MFYTGSFRFYRFDEMRDGLQLDEVGMVRNLDRLSLLSLSLKSLTLVAVTASSGRKFNGWTTRLEKMYFAELALTSGIDRRRE